MPFSKINDFLVKRLRRITSSSSFIAEIDGLRFVAILWVVLAHISEVVISQSPFVFSRKPDFYTFLYNFLQNNVRGVILFFTISGFVLALPFAKHFINKEKAVNIKGYYVRRITRIEPPYIVNIVCLFFYLIFKGTYTFAKLWPSLISALLYLNNNFYLGPTINAVAWSLEIEVQFYIIAPLLCCLFIFKKNVRRTILLSSIILLPFMHLYYALPVRTVYTYIEYFLVGFLLADLYVSNFKIVLPKILSIIIGTLAFSVIAYYPIIGSAYAEIIFLLSIFVFYFLALNDAFWKKIFSLKYLTIIGGMCYTIYLWHVFIFSPILNRTIHFKVSNNYLITLSFQYLILLPCILFFSTIIYFLIERPCMNKNWLKDSINLIKNKLQNKKVIIKASNL